MCASGVLDCWYLLNLSSWTRYPYLMSPPPANPLCKMVNKMNSSSACITASFQWFHSCCMWASLKSIFKSDMPCVQHHINENTYTLSTNVGNICFSKIIDKLKLDIAASCRFYISSQSIFRFILWQRCVYALVGEENITFWLKIPVLVAMNRAGDVLRSQWKHQALEPQRGGDQSMWTEWSSFVPLAQWHPRQSRSLSNYQNSP